MTAWDRFLTDVDKTIAKLRRTNCVDPFFRGQADSRWGLRPGLGRRKNLYTPETEGRLQFQFRTLGQHLMPRTLGSWDELFYMQHHGLPTRLLDWSEVFSVALHFALPRPRSHNSGALWILDPYELNQLTMSDSDVPHLDEAFQPGYASYFVNHASEHYGKFPASIVAVAGTSGVTRIRSQRAGFTFHGNLRLSIEKAYPSVVTRIDLPHQAVTGARTFLARSGINEFSLYQDLDALARYLRLTELLS